MPGIKSEVIMKICPVTVSIETVNIRKLKIKYI